MSMPDLWACGLTICVDGARDNGVWSVGALLPFLGVRVFRPPNARFHFAANNGIACHCLGGSVGGTAG